ncbi:MAG: cytochrome c family protein [Desulfovibrionaceae bacterium]|nr:cytochrome c family protein [Desulfovibrionaceae bacterium]
MPKRRHLILVMMIGALSAVLALQAYAAGEKRYIGSKACGECHTDEYANFMKYAKKAHSCNSIKIMANGLTEDELKTCYSCHTTGYGKPGGFVSMEKTPEMADAGCEVCHGPGSAHSDSGGDVKDIILKMKISDCEVCHSVDRVKAFNFKPMLFGGAH